MKVFEIETTNERILPNSGIALVGAILEQGGFIERANKADVTGKRSGNQIKDGEIFATFIALCCMGKPDFAAVHEMDDDPEFYRLSLGLSRIPSEEALRQRMDKTGRSKRGSLLEENARLLKANGCIPSKLPSGYVPLDIDVTPQDNSKTKKEGVSRTYKGYDGMAPMMGYIGTEGYMVNTELREGKQHCQKHTPEFLKETIGLCKKLVSDPLLVRLDSGNDAAENIGILMDEGCSFIIKRNLRQESREGWLDHVRGCCKDMTGPREGKTVYTGSTWKDVSWKGVDGAVCTRKIRAVYEITERSIDKHGQFLLPHDVEVDMYWTNTSFSDREVIDSYHAHGESEQYHSEFKDDMDIERLPSGKFDTNELVMELGMIAYNILRMIGQESLGCNDTPMKRPVKRRRLRTVIENLVMMASHVTTHARRIIIGLGRSNAWRHAFQRIYTAFVDFPVYTAG